MVAWGGGGGLKMEVKVSEDNYLGIVESKLFLHNYATTVSEVLN